MSVECRVGKELAGMDRKRERDTEREREREREREIKEGWKRVRRMRENGTKTKRRSNKGIQRNKERMQQ